MDRYQIIRIIHDYMSRYEKKNKSDSQKCIRLPLSFFSFYPFPRALKPVVCCLREEWVMDLLHDDVVYLVGMSRYFPLTVVNESICGHARGITQR